ncbi:HNH endonuclease [Glutamicibacter creatinolyticus]|uniref:HNH endonuclease n=1 Tax=Glutamicibacter creatinolyticus TaxID=162496 RepID=UPI003D2EAFF9
MATSRTGTTEWLKAVRLALHIAQANGIHQCPYCGTTLDYKNRRKPNGAQVDHKLADAHGGSIEQHNLHVCCARCNQSKGKRTAPKRKTVLAKQPLRTSRNW